jgi:hypothetical protein
MISWLVAEMDDAALAEEIERCVAALADMPLNSSSYATVRAYLSQLYLEERDRKRAEDR